ncbi:MAG: hypothetical protein WC447_02325 [Candidatus Paceibacterota bacterium]
MKNLFMGLLIFSTITLLVGCSSNLTKPEALPKMLPIKSQPTLTTKQIQELESAEAKKAEEKYSEIKKKRNERLKSQPKVTNVFTGSDIKEVLLDIATQTKTNIIVDESVQGTISVSFINTPLEAALTQVLSVGGFNFRCMEGYYIVGKAIPENLNFGQLSSTRVITTNQEAIKVVDQISEYYKQYMSPSKTGNSLTLTGPSDVLDELEKVIAIIDKTKRQIEVSVRFVLFQWSKGTNLGMQWGDINLGALGTGEFKKEVPGIFVGNLTGQLSNLLKANGYEAKMNIIAEPRIVVEDGSEGEIKITQEDLYLILSGGGAFYNYFTTKEVETGIKMKVKPFISRDGMLRIVLNHEISDIIGERKFENNGSSQNLPSTARRSETTTIRVENGKTIAIGGLLMQSKQDNADGIPGLSSIPALGSTVFGGLKKSQEDTELVVFVTPRVIQ